MSLIGIKKLIKKSKINILLIFLITFIVLSIIMITSRFTKTYSFKVGEIAKEDIEATREITDKNKTDELKETASSSVLMQYNKKTDVKAKVQNDINALFAEALQLKDANMDDKAKVTKLKSDFNINITDDEYKNLVDFSKDDLKSLQSFLIQTISSLYDSNIEDNNESLNKAYDSITYTFNNSNDTTKYSKNLKSVGLSIAKAEVKPNFFYDKDKTEELRKEAVKKVESVIIKKDQIVVKKGEPVTANQIEVLKELGLLDNNRKFDWYIYEALAGLVLLILILQWYYMFRYCKWAFQDISKLILINILIVLSVLLARCFSLASPYIIPFACIPTLMCILLDYKLSTILNILNCVLISAVVGFKVDITLLAMINACFCGIVIRRLHQRNDIIYSAIAFGIINALLTFFIGFLVSNNIYSVLTKSGFSALSAMISAVLAIGFLPFFESMFDIVTTVKLLELSNPNSPLLKKLLIEAPGTYHHSLLVANLSEVAAGKVGANTILTRVAAYYHDVGKIKRPYFFKENQLGNENPHDNITPNLSALIITAHVKDGLEMAKEYKLPKEIQNIIAEHHGTYLVKYFYLIVKNSSSNPEDIKEANFRYPGPIPSSKESGIIMLADAVEASVRSISDPTDAKIEEMVNNIVKERLNEGQLDHCDLTLKDIDIIKKSFLKSLSAIYHKRVEYPNDKWEDKDRGVV